MREFECGEATVYILDLGQFVTRDRANTAFTYVWSLIGFVLPVLTLIYCNGHLLRALRESRRMRRMYVVNTRMPTTCGNRMTPTLVAVCIYPRLFFEVDGLYLGQVGTKCAITNKRICKLN